MRKISLIFLILSYHLILNAQMSMPLDTLYSQFERVKKICENDNGKLWGRSLYGPIIVVDKSSKMIVANQPDKEGKLKQQGMVFVGNYPEHRIVASTATEFAGNSWAMVSFPFHEEDEFDVDLTFIHESFHRIQNELGFDCSVYDNSHMDKMEARIFLNLEWHALLTALDATSEIVRNRAVKDALLFRQYRRQLFPESDSMENRFELYEGLATYTAYKLCCESDVEMKEKTVQLKTKYLNNEGSYVRTFGYYSGLLYGCLLDKAGISWQKELKCEDDLGLLLQHLLNLDLAHDTTDWLNDSKGRYPFKEIYQQELAVNEEKEKIKSEYKTRFTSTVLTIDLIKPTFGIYTSPRPLDTLGTVYPLIDISDEWGYLKVSDKGCLITSTKAIVTADKLSIGEHRASGDGWNIELNANWTIVKQNDNYLIQEELTLFIHDEEQIQNLITQALKWADSKNSIDLLPVLTDSKDSVYVGFDLVKHRKNLEVLNQTNLFTVGFIENYNQIILTLNIGLRNGHYDKWLVGDLPTFIFANDHSPWWNGQESFSIDQGTVELIRSDKNNREYYFKCGNKQKGCEGLENFKLKFKVIKEAEKFKISYLEGFDFKESTRRDGL